MIQASDTNLPDALPELSLYVHIPWCLKKCPYCDFNSHTFNGDLPEKEYLQALLADIDHDTEWTQNREIKSIFFGGGTPSLFSADFFAEFLERSNQKLQFSADIEITMEANPGTLECAPYKALLNSGINRISLGIQSLNSEALKRLGRIHSAQTALDALKQALDAGFNRVNADLMFGLPQQPLQHALSELEQLIETGVKHISWYQLTLEPNTQFYKQPPPLPNDDTLADMAEAGHALLAEAGLKQYEVSAFAETNHNCQHNTNYWRFGDYLGIGAGAHGKLTLLNDERSSRASTIRTTRTRLPQHYLGQSKPGKATVKTVEPEDLVFEYCLNRFRLFEPIPIKHMINRTGCSNKDIEPLFQDCVNQGWMTRSDEKETEYLMTSKGRLFLNDVIATFLPQADAR